MGQCVVAWSVCAAACLRRGCGDMGCFAVAPAFGGLWEWTGVRGLVPAQTPSIMNKRDSNKEKERTSEDKRTST